MRSLNNIIPTERKQRQEMVRKTVFLSHQSNFVIQAVLVVSLLKFSRWVSATSIKRALPLFPTQMPLYHVELEKIIALSLKSLIFVEIQFNVVFHIILLAMKISSVSFHFSILFQEYPKTLTRTLIMNLHDIHLSKNTFEKWKRQACRESNIFFQFFVVKNSGFFPKKKNTGFLLENEL